jgi:hypothetical protein
MPERAEAHKGTGSPAESGGQVSDTVRLNIARLVTFDVVFDSRLLPGVCSQLLVDTHITPGPHTPPNGPGIPLTDGTAILSAALQSLLHELNCTGGGLAVLEENKCSIHYDRALSNAGAAATLQQIGIDIETTSAVTTGVASGREIAGSNAGVKGACVSQCWMAASHSDGCGEGHILVSSTVVAAQSRAQFRIAASCSLATLFYAVQSRSILVQPRVLWRTDGLQLIRGEIGPCAPTAPDTTGI